MLTRSGKIVFTLGFLVVVVLGGVIFLKSSPNTDIPSFVALQQSSSFEPTEEMLNTLRKPLSSFGVDADTVSGGVYFSPGGQYVLFQADPKPVEGQMESGSRVIFADIKKGTMKKIYDGTLVGAPSWSENIVTFSSDGIYMYNMNEGVLNVVSSAGLNPLISPDEHFIAYQDKGINIFSIQSRGTTVLTENKYDRPALWMNDVTKLLVFKSNGVELGEGAGEQQFVGIIDSVTKNIQELTSVPKGRFYGAKKVGNSILINGGFDDGRSDYLLNPENDTTTTINQGVALAEVLVDSSKDTVNVYSNGVLKSFDATGATVGMVTLANVSSSDIPYWFKSDDSTIWLGYLKGSDVSQVEILKWNKKTGEQEGTPFLLDSSTIFFSQSSVYASLSQDRTTLIFNIIK